MFEGNPERGTRPILVSDRIFRYFENSLVQVALGIFGGLAGTFLDGRWFVFLTPFAVSALHRGKVLEALSRQIKILVYIITTLVAGAIFYFGGVKMNGARDKEYSALIQVIRSIPSTSVSTQQWFWPKPPASKSPPPTSTQSSEPDELLVQAKRELNNCNGFLANSESRMTKMNSYEVGVPIKEIPRRLGELNSKEPGGPPPAVVEANRDRLQSQLNDAIQRFRDHEFQTWGKTYGPEFEIAYHQVMEKVSAPQDFYNPNPMEEPRNFDGIKHQCSNMATLIQAYEAKGK